MTEGKYAGYAMRRSLLTLTEGMAGTMPSL